LLQAGSTYFALTVEKLGPIVAELQTKVAELADVLALELPMGESYLDLLVASQSRLSDLTATAIAAGSLRPPEAELLDLTTDLQNEMRAVLGRPSANAPRRNRAAGSAPARLLASSARTTSAHPPNATPTPHSPAAEIGFTGQVAAAIQRARQARVPVSLAMLAVDHHSELLLHLGPGGVADLLHWLQRDLSEWLGERTSAQPIGQATFGIVLEQCSRSDAVAAARQALAAMKTWSLPGGLDLDLAPSLSAGIASLTLPPKNFEAQALVDGARRCLAGAQLSGGGTVKSIEL
jgi:GGDEF domain-containing protein